MLSHLKTCKGPVDDAHIKKSFVIRGLYKESIGFLQTSCSIAVINASLSRLQ